MIGRPVGTHNRSSVEEQKLYPIIAATNSSYCSPHSAYRFSVPQDTLWNEKSDQKEGTTNDANGARIKERG